MLDLIRDVEVEGIDIVTDIKHLCFEMVQIFADMEDRRTSVDCGVPDEDLEEAWSVADVDSCRRDDGVIFNVGEDHRLRFVGH